MTNTEKPTDAEIAESLADGGTQTRLVDVDAENAALVNGLESDGELRMIPFGDIVLGDNARQGARADAGLIASIDSRGIVQPVLVRALDGGSFELTAGYRRHDALTQLGVSDYYQVPALVRDSSDVARVVDQLTENIHREDMSPIDEARAIEDLIAIGIPMETLVSVLGMSKSVIATRRRLLKLPNEAQNLVNDGDLSLEAADALAGIVSEVGPEIAESVASQGAGAVAALVNRTKNAKTVKKGEALVKKHGFVPATGLGVGKAGAEDDQKAVKGDPISQGVIKDGGVQGTHVMVGVGPDGRAAFWEVEYLDLDGDASMAAPATAGEARRELMGRRAAEAAKLATEAPMTSSAVQDLCVDAVFSACVQLDILPELVGLAGLSFDDNPEGTDLVEAVSDALGDSKARLGFIQMAFAVVPEMVFGPKNAHGYMHLAFHSSMEGWWNPERDATFQERAMGEQEVASLPSK